MPDITIPERAIEAGARALRYEESSGMCELDRVCALCDCMYPETRDAYARLHAQKVLEAAAPHIATQALRDAADEDFTTESGIRRVGYLRLRDRADQIEADQG